MVELEEMTKVASETFPMELEDIIYWGEFIIKNHQDE